MAKRQDFKLVQPPSKRGIYIFLIMMVLLSAALGSAAYFYQQQLHWFLVIRPKEKELMKTYQFYGRQHIAEPFKGDTFIHSDSYNIIDNDMNKILNQIQQQKIIDQKQAQKMETEQNSVVKLKNYNNLIFFEGPKGTGKSSSLIKVANQIKNKQGWYLFYYDLSKIFPKYSINSFTHVLNGLTLNQKNQLNTKNLSNKKIKFLLKKFMKSISELLQHEKNAVIVFDSINVIDGEQSVQMFMKELAKLVRNGVIFIGAAPNSEVIDFLENVDNVYKRSNWIIRQTKQLLKKELRRYTKVNYPNLMKEDIENIVFYADSFSEIRSIAKLSPDAINKLKSKIAKKLDSLVSKKPKYLKSLCQLCTKGKMNLSQKQIDYLGSKEIIENSKLWRSRLEKIIFEENYAEKCNWDQQESHTCYDLRDIQQQQYDRSHRSILFGLDDKQIRAIIERKIIQEQRIPKDEKQQQDEEEQLAQPEQQQDQDEKQQETQQLNIRAINKFKNLIQKIQQHPRNRLKPKKNRANKKTILQKLKLLSNEEENEEKSPQQNKQDDQNSKLSNKQKTILRFKQLLQKIKEQPRKRLKHKKNPNINQIIYKIFRMANKSTKNIKQHNKNIQNDNKHHEKNESINKVSAVQRFRQILENIKSKPRKRLQTKKLKNIDQIFFKLTGKHRRVQKQQHSIIQQIKSIKTNSTHQVPSNNATQTVSRILNQKETSNNTTKQKTPNNTQMKIKSSNITKSTNNETKEISTSITEQKKIEQNSTGSYRFKSFLAKIKQTPRKRLKNIKNKNIDAIFFKLTGKHLNKQQHNQEDKQIKNQAQSNATKIAKNIQNQGQEQKATSVSKFKQLLTKIQLSPRQRMKTKKNKNIDSIYQRLTGKHKINKQESTSAKRQQNNNIVQQVQHQEKKDYLFSKHVSIKTHPEKIQPQHIQQEVHIKKVRLETKPTHQKNTQ